MRRYRHLNTCAVAILQRFIGATLTRALVLAGLAVACTPGDTKTAAPGDSVVSTSIVFTTSSTTTSTVAPWVNDTSVDAASATLPSELAAVAEFGEKLYGAAKASNWGEAVAIMDSLDRAAKSFPVGVNARSADALELPRVLDSLRQAVTVRQRPAMLQLSNRVTYLAAKVSAGYHPQVPSEIALLDYSGRELELWSARRSASMLIRTAAELQRTWNAARPDVVRHGGMTEAEKMDSLVTLVASAKTAADYGRVATPILDHVDVLESLYTKPLGP
jgi:hypothetical protein